MVDLIAGGVLVTKENLVDQLEHNRREAGNIIGREQTEMRQSWIEKGNKKPGSVAGLCLMDMSLLCSLYGHLFKNISNLFFRRYCVDPP